MKKSKQNIKINGDELHKKITELFNQNNYKSFNYKQIASELEITNREERIKIQNILSELTETGTIKEISKGKYISNFGNKEIIGTIDVNKSRNAYLISDDVKEDVFIAFTNLHTAMHNDTVKIRLFVRNGKTKIEGIVVEIIKRANLEFVGIIKKSKNFSFFISDNPKMIYSVFVPKENLNGAKDGEKVIIEIINWRKREKNPTGKVKEVLGMQGNNNVEMHAILAEFGLPNKFPENLENEAKKISTKITKKDFVERTDFRNITTFTIDPADAKDFDDALSLEFLENKNYKIGVHIADVSHYIQPNSALDLEASERATSVYLVDRVVPMLPENLSNNLCSLRPNEEKLCFSVIFEMNDEAKILNYSIEKTIIKSDKRFTYEEAQEILETKIGIFAEELLTMDKLAKILRQKRFTNGAFNFDHKEIKFILDENSFPVSVFFKVSKDSNNLVEEFMLLANRKVAEHIGKMDKEFVYRVHAEPDLQKLEVLRNFINRYGYKIDNSSKTRLSKTMNNLINDVVGKPESSIIENLSIRAMAKAIYDTNNIGHYGLSFEYYTHFTSPIRRYPDVLVHRLLYSYLKKNKVNTDDLKTLCKHCSFKENQATQAERASIKYKQVEFLQDKIGQIFQGIISGVAEYGLFVELIDNKCEGLVHISTFKDDIYLYEPENFQIIGENNGKKYQLGDVISVKIINVNFEKKQIDLVLFQK
ncbi:MAG: ribonuclease R [Bacteroidales bacterium]|jgi:ribonuclease R|nr:ribonuclease R [Bacteroidales bacterium]